MNFSLYNVFDTILYLGSIQGFILTVLLFRIKSNTISNKLLGILTSLWAIILLVFALQSLGIHSKYPHLLNTFSQLLFAWFPLLYLSVKYFFTNHSKFNSKDLFHFIPLVVGIIIQIPFYTLSGEEKIQSTIHSEGIIYIANSLNDEMLSIQGVVYSVIILIILRNYEDRIVDFYANINQPIITWIRVGVIFILIAWTIGIIGTITERAHIDIGIDLFYFVYLSFVIIIYGISFVALRSGEIYKLKSEHIRELISIDSEDKSRNNKNRKLQNSSQYETIIHNDEDKIENELNEKLIEFFKTSKPYLNPDLSLQSLASDLSISRHQLSATINMKQNMNFFELVNEYRINEVKELMKKDSEGRMKIYELAYDAGFNSKATFYRIFKQFTGLTPSEYRSKLSISETVNS